MHDFEKFRIWLNENTDYTNQTKSNILSRLKRVDKILPLCEEKIYLFNLSMSDQFNNLSVSVKSQLRRAVKIYLKYIDNKGK